MQAPGIGRHTVEAKQDLVEQVRTTFWEGNAKQDRPTVLRLRERSKADALSQFFCLIDKLADRGF
jgi:hypothetical protein